MDSTNSPQSLEQSGAIGGTAAGQQQAAFYGQAVAEQTLMAYHGDHAVKHKYVGRMRAHQEADELIRGTYWRHGKGCAIGCTVHSNHHAAYETELGIPQWLAYLEDAIFEGMSDAASRRFPLRLLSAVPVGFAEWDHLYHDFCAFLLRDICEFDRTKHPDVAATVDTVARLHERWIGTDDQAWHAAGLAAWSAMSALARSAALSASARWKAVESAAVSVAESAALAARLNPSDPTTSLKRAAIAESAALAARSAARSTADSAARSAAYDRMGDWLVRRFDAAEASH